MKKQNSISNLLIKIPVLIIGFLFFSNCYFNPAIQSVLNPTTSESNSSGALALLAGGGSSVSTADTSATLQVLGQLKSSGVSVANATLSLGSTSSSVKDVVAVSTTATTNAIGKFLLKLRPGTYTISVTSSAGVSLGSFSLVVNGTTVTQGSDSGTFTLLGLTTYTLDQTVTLTTEFTVVSSSPVDGEQNAPTITGPSPASFLCSFVFSNTVDASTMVPGNIGFSTGGTTITPSVSGNTASIIFSGNNIFAFPMYSYTITLTNNIKDTDGFSLTPKAITIKLAGAAL
ncbi:hypothetical protein LPTSP3_g04790 [Leptospira kobayashii]|uniref:SbsA Ig-like domain-containing protein n=1 Tax=Leptospira kobayashii TaxID=1917830 RepID=A0ABM7UGC6_9LEPT|nr:Ig-like domain-containing protein [Leptospira kobayashii]BDA77549.1 hypothetical protein LPTSP3_g04790 [Leptospira kobayashii]